MIVPGCRSQLRGVVQELQARLGLLDGLGQDQEKLVATFLDLFSIPLFQTRRQRAEHPAIFRSLSAKYRQRGPGRLSQGSLVAGKVKAGEVRFLEHRILPEPLEFVVSRLALNPGFFNRPVRLALGNHSSDPCGQIVETAFLAKLSFDSPENRVGILPSTLSEQSLGLEQTLDGLISELGLVSTVFDPRPDSARVFRPGRAHIAVANGRRRASFTPRSHEACAALGSDHPRETAPDPRPALAVRSRLYGSLCKQCRQIVSRSLATLGTKRVGGTTSSSTTWRIVSIGVCPLNGGRPVNIS